MCALNDISAAIHNSFARSSNLADITAKTGTQSICASLAGTSLGIGISSMVGSEWGIPLVLSFAALSTTHLAVTMWSLNSVTLNTINPKVGSFPFSYKYKKIMALFYFDF